MLPSRKIWQTKIYAGHMLVRVVRSEGAPSFSKDGYLYIRKQDATEGMYVTGGTVISEQVEESSPLPDVATNYATTTK